MTCDICGQPQVAKSLNVASCKMISASGEAFGNSQLAEAKSLDDPAPLTAVMMIEDVRSQRFRFAEFQNLKLSKFNLQCTRLHAMKFSVENTFLSMWHVFSNACSIPLYFCAVQDPLLRMIGFQDADGNLLAEASRSELRRIALVVGEKLLKATCNLIRPTAGQRFLMGKSTRDWVKRDICSWSCDFCQQNPKKLAVGWCW